MIARYASRELRTVYFNGVGYVVRLDLHPCTRFTDHGPETAQGSTVYVGARQGTGSEGGFRYARYLRWPFPQCCMARPY